MNDRIAVLGLVGLFALAGCGNGGGEPAGNQQAPVEARQTADEAGPAATPIPEPGDQTGADVGTLNGSPDTPVSSEGGTTSGPASGSAPGSGGGAAPAARGAGADPVEPPSAPAGTDAGDILERAENAYSGVRSMEADFVQEVYVPLLESSQHSRGKLFHRSPDRFLMRFSQPEGDLVVTDGRYIWMYYPSNDPGQVMRAPLAEGGQQVDLQREFLSDATSRYTATRTGSRSIGGREAHALTLVPRGQSPYSEVRIWVDTADHLVRRFEITEQNGTIRRLEMSNLHPNVTLSDDLFDFSPPPGVQVFEP